MKPSQWRRSWAGKYLRHVPRIKHLRGTFLHRAFGERLFDARVWHWDRHGAALGLAIGAFFSVLPMPLQSVPAAFLAVIFRANLPAALVGCWITNPLTFPLFLYLQLKIGSFLLDRPSLMEQFQAIMDKLTWRFWQLFTDASGVWGLLFLGGAVLGAVLGTACYFLTLLGYDLGVRAIERAKKRRAVAVKR
ncbi:MAG: DUF2062 domain-containing protein [Chthoniobacterales bacterium]